VTGTPPFRSRPLALGRTAAVSSPHVAASDAAIGILASGGNAVDAAVAAAAVATVVQPWSSSVAGVGWATVHRPGMPTEVLDFHGIVPEGLDPATLPAGSNRTVDWPRLEREQSPLLGSLVPGVASGWEELQRRFGRRSLAAVLEPAAILAGNGFPVSEALHRMIDDNRSRLVRWPASARVFLPDGEPLAVGAVLLQPDLAVTLRRLGEGGAIGFRSGPMASAIARFYGDNGGAVTAGDLERYEPTWLSALEIEFRGLSVRCVPTALGDVSFAMGLRLLDALSPFAGPTDDSYIDASVASARLVDTVRSASLGPRVSVREASELLAATRWPAEPHPATTNAGGGLAEDTITLAVVDGEGMAVNLMQTVGTFFGTGATVPGLGVLANSSLYFAMPANSGANRIVPGHGVEQNPCLATVLDRAGRLRLVVGSPGGRTRVETVRQMIVNVVDFAMTVQEAVDCPRFLAHPDGRTVEFERRYGPVDPGLRQSLEARGHLVSDGGEAAGSGQAIALDPASGTLMAAADWRRESIARAF